MHFACARSHGKNALIQLIEESDTSITYRDELYRTARDVSLQANQPDNAKEIDRYVLGLAARGDLETIRKMVLDGYDHIMVSFFKLNSENRSKSNKTLDEFLNRNSQMLMVSFQMKFKEPFIGNLVDDQCSINENP